MKKLGIILLIILVALAIWMIVKTDKVADEPIVNDGGASGQFAKLAADALVVRDQRPGDVVIASAVNLSQNGFVVVMNDAGGKPGAIIGVSEFLVAGAYADIDVGTTQNMFDGVEYHAELVRDNGDGIFDPKDDRVVRWNGEDMVASFAVDKDAPDPRTIEINY